ncbi:MAG: HNH endonuclease [Desulfovibrio sp.]|jgi:5-methylcytosine-specific restriction protein A|nr:HNH endonuclease [Desulfovibrio sp.]
MARRIYNLKTWKYVRLSKLSASPWCEYCGAPASQVDHITPVESGGHPFDMDNLQCLCQTCHSRKSAAEDGGYGNRRKVKGCRPDGTPLDPRHEWNREKKNLPARDRKTVRRK